MKRRKMNDEERQALLLNVAQKFYRDGLTKTEIANEIRVSSTEVARLLKAAREAKIVRIEFCPPTLEALGQELEQRFRWLKKAVVVASVKDPIQQRLLLAKAGAQYFEETVEAGTKVGIGGGYTVFEMIAALPTEYRDIDVYPTAIIGMGPTIAHIDPIALVTLLWAKSGGEPGRAHYVTLPPSEKGASRAAVKRQYEKHRTGSKKVQEIFDEMSKVDIIFCSIGAIEVKPEYRELKHYSTNFLLGEMSIKEKEFKDEGAVGDILYCFFDENGECPKSTWNVFLSHGVGQAVKMVEQRKTVLVMVGNYKMKALKAIIKGKLCNVLITEEEAAKELIEWNDVQLRTARPAPQPLLRVR